MPSGTQQWFVGSADLQPLTARNKADLTVAASKSTIQEELKRRGAVASRATGTVVVVVEKGKVQGSRWMMVGNLGPVWVTGDKLGLKKNVEASINLSDLTSWEFPTAKDSRINSNQSFWKDGGEVTTSLKDGTQMLDDGNKIKSHSMITSPGFSLRLTVAPGKGGTILMWLSVAPLSLAKLKVECITRDLDITSPFIPTYGAKLPPGLAKQMKYETSGNFIPQCKGKGPKPSQRNPRQDNLSAGWGLYPLLQKTDTGPYPSSEDVYREFAKSLRGISGHNNRKGCKSLYSAEKQWEKGTTWVFDEPKLWPEPSTSITEPATAGGAQVMDASFGGDSSSDEEDCSTEAQDRLVNLVAEREERFNASLTLEEEHERAPSSPFLETRPSGSSRIASTPGPSTESADSRSGANVVHLLLEAQQKIIKELTDMSKSENDESRKTFMKALNAMVTNVNDKEHQIVKKREEDKYQSDPVTLRTIQGGEDDGHKVFAWGARRSYQQPNVEPSTYWADAKYSLDVVPNYKEALFLQHMVPLSISSRAKTWSGKPTTTFNIRYWTHSQATTSSSKRKSEVCFSSTSADGENLVTVGEKWQDASDCNEVVEALLNYTSCVFMTRPWDWTGIVLIRACHDMCYFGRVTDNPREQRTVMESFIDEVRSLLSLDSS